MVKTEKNIIEKILNKGIAAGQIPAMTKSARDWYMNAASWRNVKHNINEGNLIRSDSKRLTNNLNIGSMYLFQYDPKHKDTLPYYDRAPLIFPFMKVKDGFYGINLHYLPLELRARLMDALYDQTNNKKYDETTKLKISYEILKSVASLKYYKPCIKRYLYSHVRSQFMLIHPKEWSILVALPVARFTKMTASQVYNESRKSMK